MKKISMVFPVVCTVVIGIVFSFFVVSFAYADIPGPGPYRPLPIQDDIPEYVPNNNQEISDVISIDLQNEQTNEEFWQQVKKDANEARTREILALITIGVGVLLFAFVGGMIVRKVAQSTRSELKNYEK